MKSKKLLKAPIFLAAIIIGLIYAYIKSSPVVAVEDLQTGIADKIIRFHIVANSDSDEDQELKLKVKEAVVTYTSTLLESSKSIEESEKLINEHYDEILSIARDTISENGYDYPVYCTMGYEYFPTRSYGNYTFPPGQYKAFQVKIGEAKGKNWWCVLYPPLCFIDMCHGTYGDYDDNILSQTLSPEEYDAVTGKYVIKYRFKYLTFLNER